MTAFDHAARIARARASLRDRGLVGLLLSVGPDLPYLTGYEAMPLERLTMFVLTAGQAVLVVPRLEGIEHGVIMSNQKVDLLTHDVNLALNSSVREIVRLQMQIEVLQQLVEDLHAAAEGGLTLIGEADRQAAGPPAIGQHKRVG